MAELFAVVRIRGPAQKRHESNETLKMLRLTRANHCVLVPKNRDFEGMLKKAKDLITWGEIDREALERLVEKRGRFPGDKRLPKEKAFEISRKILNGEPVDIKNVFRLSPPSKGFSSVKLLYPKGDLGYRREKINELLKRMM